MIQIEHISKNFEGKEILKDLSLSVGQGEFVALCGKSGCGKSTLLNIIGGFESFDSGCVNIAGREFKERVRVRGCVKIAQDYALLPWSNALDNVAFGLRAKGLSTKEAKQEARYYLNLVHLQGFESAFPHTLSGGQAQRVALARALSVKPDILLLDEPFSALDSFTKEALQNELLHISHQLKTTMIFVTHDIEEAIFLASRVVVLQEGAKTTQVSIKLDKTLRDSLEFLNLKREIANLISYGTLGLEYSI